MIKSHERSFVIKSCLLCRQYFLIRLTVINSINDISDHPICLTVSAKVAICPKIWKPFYRTDNTQSSRETFRNVIHGAWSYVTNYNFMRQTTISSAEEQCQKYLPICRVLSSFLKLCRTIQKADNIREFFIPWISSCIQIRCQTSLQSKSTTLCLKRNLRIIVACPQTSLLKHQIMFDY